MTFKIHLMDYNNENNDKSVLNIWAEIINTKIQTERKVKKEEKSTILETSVTELKWMGEIKLINRNPLVTYFWFIHGLLWK